MPDIYERGNRIESLRVIQILRIVCSQFQLHAVLTSLLEVCGLSFPNAKPDLEYSTPFLYPTPEKGVSGPE